jgi:hypothetical protein
MKSSPAIEIDPPDTADPARKAIEPPTDVPLCSPAKARIIEPSRPAAESMILPDCNDPALGPTKAVIPPIDAEPTVRPAESNMLVSERADTDPLDDVEEPVRIETDVPTIF